jgi:hypothetical protein
VSSKTTKAERELDPHADAELAYRRARERYELLWEEWNDEGRPTTALGGSTGRVVVPHPLFLMLQQAETQMLRAAKAFQPSHRGPDPVSKVTAQIGRSPAAKLREGKGS